MIYFIKPEGVRCVKIGYVSRNIEARRRALQVGNHRDLILVGFMDGSKADEREIHRRFADLNIERCARDEYRMSEWFLLSADLRDFIRQRSVRCDFTDGVKPPPPRWYKTRMRKRIPRVEVTDEMLVEAINGRTWAAPQIG